MCIPTTWRKAGDYALRLFCEGTPAQDSVVELYTGSGFALLKRQPMEQGQNEVTFTLEADDKYFMILIKSGQAQALRIADLSLEKR